MIDIIGSKTRTEIDQLDLLLKNGRRGGMMLKTSTSLERLLVSIDRVHSTNYHIGR